MKKKKRQCYKEETRKNRKNMMQEITKKENYKKITRQWRRNEKIRE